MRRQRKPIPTVMVDPANRGQFLALNYNRKQWEHELFVLLEEQIRIGLSKCRSLADALRFEEIKKKSDALLAQEPPKPQYKRQNIPAAIRKKILHTGAVCHYCGDSLPKTIDHKTPVIAGGTNSEDNLVPCCQKCNTEKHATPYEEFIQK